MSRHLPKEEHMAQFPKGYRALANSERPPAPGVVRMGPMDPKETLSVSIRVRRRLDGPSLPNLNTLAAASLTQRGYLSREDFAASYGAAQADLDQVVAFAQSQGLTVAETRVRCRSRRVWVTSSSVCTAWTTGGLLGRSQGPRPLGRPPRRSRHPKWRTSTASRRDPQPVRRSESSSSVVAIR